MLNSRSSEFSVTTYDLVFAITVFFLSFLWFHYLWINVSTDIQTHASFIREIQNGQRSLPANFIYYLVVNIISGFNPSNLEFASILTLSCAVLLKFFISKYIIREIVSASSEYNLLINCIAFTLLFITSLPSIPFIFSGNLYVGTYPANVWHNSTTIFVMPFTLLLFWQSYKQIERFNPTRHFYIVFLVILNILIKPSFVFVFIIAYPILVFLTFRFSKSFWRNLIPVFSAVILVFIQYIIIYNIRNVSGDSGIAIKPFFLLKYRLESSNWFYLSVIFLFSMITSYLFPIIYLLRNPVSRNELLVRYVLLCGAIGILIRHLLCETGIREHAGNFVWQVIMCSYLIILIFTSKLFKKLINSKWNFSKYKYEFFALSLHLIFGVIYILKIAFLRSYM